MREFATRVEAGGGRVLTSACSGLVRASLAPILEGLAKMGADVATLTLPDLQTARAQLVARTAACKDRATVFILEDVHWSAVATIESFLS